MALKDLKEKSKQYRNDIKKAYDEGYKKGYDAGFGVANSKGARFCATRGFSKGLRTNHYHQTHYARKGKLVYGK